MIFLTIKDDIIQARACAKKMNMEFPAELFYDAMKYKSIGEILKVEALPDGSWVPRGTPFAQLSNVVKGFGDGGNHYYCVRGLLLHVQHEL